MDKQLIEMMGKMMEQMNVVQTDMKNMESGITGMQTDMKDMKTDIKGMKVEIADMKTDMNTRFDAVDDKLNGVGEHFVEASKNTIQLREDMQKELK